MSLYSLRTLHTLPVELEPNTQDRIQYTVVMKTNLPADYLVLQNATRTDVYNLNS